MDETNLEVTQEQEAIWADGDSDVLDEIRQLRAQEAEEASELEETEEEVEEQPAEEEDSDIEADEDEEETEDSEEVQEDGEDNSTEDQAEEGETEESTEPEAKVHKFKANGQEFEFTEQEIIESFGKVFGQSLDYTKKTQEIAPWRKTISALKEENISQDDLNLMIDVLKGDKDAFTAVAKRVGIDTLELDMESDKQYVPNQYGKDETTLAIEEVVSQISRDPEYRQTQYVVDEQWDMKSRQVLAENPQMIAGLHQDIKDGIYEKVAPMAIKAKMLDGGSKSDLEYYIEAGKQFYSAPEVETETKAAVEAEQERQAKQAAIQKNATKKKAASLPKSKAGKKDVIDYLDESDEAYDEWYKKVMNAV